MIGPNSQYSMDTNGDGRGTMTLENAAGVGVNSIQTFGLAVVNSPQHALITEFDSSATSNGSLDLQTTSDLKMAAITGSYAFLFSGFDVSSYPELKPWPKEALSRPMARVRLKAAAWETLTTTEK